MFAREWPLRLGEKSGQQRIFALCQRDRDAIGIGQLSRSPIELPAVKSPASPFLIPLHCYAARFPTPH